MAELIMGFIRNTVSRLASFVMFDVIKVNNFLGYFGLALETIEQDKDEKRLERELETKRKIEAEEMSQRKKIKPSEDLANLDGEDVRDEEVERPGSRQKLWNLRPEINFTESLEMKVNFYGPKKKIAPTESFEGDILRDVIVNDVETEDAAETASDVVFVSNVDVVNNPYHFESVTQYVVIPSNEIKDNDNASPSQPAVVEKDEPLPVEVRDSQDDAVELKEKADPVRDVEVDNYDDDTVLITTQELTKLVNEEAFSQETNFVDDAQNDRKVEIIIDGEVDDILGLNEGGNNVDFSGKKDTAKALLDIVNGEKLNTDRKQSEIVDVESDENDEIIEKSTNSSSSLEFGLEAAEDSFVDLDEASDLLTDKTNVDIVRSTENCEDKVQIISHVNDKENKATETKSNKKKGKGKNKKKVF